MVKHAQGPDMHPAIAQAIALCEREIDKLTKLSDDSQNELTPAIADNLPSLTRCLMSLLKYNQQDVDDEALLEALLQDGKVADLVDKIRPPSPGAGARIPKKGRA